jgi:hypothetical protein
VWKPKYTPYIPHNNDNPVDSEEGRKIGNLHSARIKENEGPEFLGHLAYVPTLLQIFFACSLCGNYYLAISTGNSTCSPWRMMVVLWTIVLYMIVVLWMIVL